jgi:hypothetical protein
LIATRYFAAASGAPGHAHLRRVCNKLIYRNVTWLDTA